MHSRGRKKNKNISRPAFTIVELLIVVVVISILATLSFVAYNGITDRAKDAAAKNEAKQTYTKLLTHSISNNDQYPVDLEDIGVSSSDDTFYEYTRDDPSTFCLTTTVAGISYYVSSSQSTPKEGLCDGHLGEEAPPPPPPPIADGDFLQIITSENCPSTRVRAVDARDNRTYWVQEMADGRCWMLTNLAYAGGGANTYGDVRTLTTGGSATYTEPKYYAPSGANPTTEPNNPSTATNASGQYGYLYNWCGAMGGQATAACANAETPTPDTTVTVCPASWRLPIGTPTTGEFALLNNAVNGGSTSNSSGLRSTWLGQYSGRGGSSFVNQGVYGYYWSSTQDLGSNAKYLLFGNPFVYAPDTTTKNLGLAVRCVAI